MNSTDPGLLSYAVDLSALANVGDIYRFEITAETVAGLSARSPTIAAAVASLPSKPPSAPSADYTRVESGLLVSYSSLDSSSSLNGGSAITLYEVQYDDGLGGALTHSLSTLSLNVVLPETVLTRSYRVRYRGRNFNGWGEWSDIAHLRFASYPGAPSGLAYVSSVPTNVTVALSPPSSDGGTSISNYEVWVDTVQATDSYSLLKSGNQLLFTLGTADGLIQGTLYRIKAKA